MGRKAANDTTPKKIIMSFCLNPDLAFKVKRKCVKDHIGLSVVLQGYLTEWIGEEIYGKPSAASKVQARNIS